MKEITASQLEHVKMLAEYGHTEEFIAKFCGVSVATFQRWKREDPAFEATLADWKRKADDRVEKALYERAIGFMHPEEKIFCSKEGLVTKVNTVKFYPPDATAAIFWLKNRQPKAWKEKVEHAVEGEVQHKHTVQQRSLEDRINQLVEGDKVLSDALQ